MEKVFRIMFRIEEMRQLGFKIEEIAQSLGGSIKPTKSFFGQEIRIGNTTFHL